MKEWWVKRGDQQRPVSDLATLRQYAASKRLRGEDLVRHPDTGEWRPAAQVSELEDAFAALSTLDQPRPERQPAQEAQRESVAEQADIARWIVRRGDDETSASSSAQLLEWATNGLVVPSDYVRHPFLDRWMYAADVQELSIAFARLVRRRRSGSLMAVGALYWLVGFLLMLVQLTSVASAAFALGIALFTAAIIARSW